MNRSLDPPDNLAVAIESLIGDYQPDFKPSADTKRRLLEIALALGPDQCQALYWAAVYMTKVA